MIRELWHWWWLFFSHLITFRWNTLPYHWQNLWWYLWYGFSYFDLQDTDDYILTRFNKMLIQFQKYRVGMPDGVTDLEYTKIIDRMIYLTNLLSSEDTMDLEWEETVSLRKEFFDLMEKYFFYFWF